MERVQFVRDTLARHLCLFLPDDGKADLVRARNSQTVRYCCTYVAVRNSVFNMGFILSQQGLFLGRIQ